MGLAVGICRVTGSVEAGALFSSSLDPESGLNTRRLSQRDRYRDVLLGNACACVQPDPGGFSLILSIESVAISTTESRSLVCEPVFDFTPFLSSSFRARLVGTVENVQLGDTVDVRVHALSTANADPLSNLLYSFPTITSTGSFSVSVNFTPPASSKIYVLTTQTSNTGSAGITAASWITEVIT
jgi:hypothetical protein